MAHVEVAADDGDLALPGVARLGEAGVGVLDVEDMAVVGGGVAVALVVDGAFLADGEVEADGGAPGQELGGVLLAYGQAVGMGVPGEEFGEGNVVVLGQQAVGAFEGVVVVGLDGLDLGWDGGARFREWSTYGNALDRERTQGLLTR